MHCPGCGAEAAITQKYCRSCGFNLEKVPELVAEQLPESEQILRVDLEEKLRKRQRNIEQSLSVAGMSLGAIAALSFLAGLIYLLAVGSMPIVPGIVLLVLLIGGIVAGSLGVGKPEEEPGRTRPSEDSKRSRTGFVIQDLRKTVD
jgi:hypothetical protein